MVVPQGGFKEFLHGFDSEQIQEAVPGLFLFFFMDEEIFSRFFLHLGNCAHANGDLDTEVANLVDGDRDAETPVYQKTVAETDWREDAGKGDRSSEGLSLIHI